MKKLTIQDIEDIYKKMESKEPADSLMDQIKKAEEQLVTNIITKVSGHEPNETTWQLVEKRIPWNAKAGGYRYKLAFMGKELGEIRFSLHVPGEAQMMFIPKESASIKGVTSPSH